MRRAFGPIAPPPDPSPEMITRPMHSHVADPRTPAPAWRRLLEPVVLLPALALAAIALAAWGWAAHARALRLTDLDIVYRALSIVGISSVYITSQDWGGDWRIEAARVCGALAFVLTVTGAVRALLSRAWSERRARLRRAHLVIVGGAPAARAAADAAAAAGVPTTWVAPAGAEPAPGPVITLPRGFGPGLARVAAAGHATDILVALDDEVEQIAVVRRLRAAAPGARIAMSVSDPWFADQLEHVEHLSGVRFAAPVQLAVRHLHDLAPPFQTARRLGHARLHALVFGGGRTGEAVLRDLLLTQSTTFLGIPRITLVDPRAAEIAASLAQRAPELAASAEIVFLTPEHGGHDVRALPMTELREAAAAAPFTLAHVALDTDLRTIECAVALQSRARTEGWVMGAVHARLAARGAFPRPTAHEARDTPLIGWGARDEFARDLGLFGGDPDAVPRAFHDAYRRVAPGAAATSADWADLSEAERDSNRALLAHAPAKLASLGVDITAWRAAASDGPGGLRPPPIPDLASEPALLDDLAALEHARWSVERRLCGWRHAPERDNRRRRHPGLVPWSALPEPDRAFNRVMVAAIVRALDAAT